MTPPVRPQPASTVILVRAAASGGLEVFMNRRPEGMKFLGGFYVFPGGNVKTEDSAKGILDRCAGLSMPEARRLLGSTMSPQLALAHWVAAVRELFEETGILLCRHETGASIGSLDEKFQNSLGECRLNILDRTITFNYFMAAERLLCDAGRLAYFSHWQTPEEFSMRFDTRFFLALLPQGQIPIATSPEVAESLWLAPERALTSYRDGKLPLIFPTYASLRGLADFDSLESLCAEYGLSC
jgi:8-oxo-dGTP pyrophosphatase MutT (NUDIX family)